jgi:precorrin-4 methylase
VKNFIRKPSIDLYPGIIVTKDTVLEYKNENVIQTVKDLTLHSVTKVKGANYKSKYDTTIKLQEGDVLIFEGEGRGYIKPVDSFVTIAEAIEDLTNIKDLG